MPSSPSFWGPVSGLWSLGAVDTTDALRPWFLAIQKVNTWPREGQGCAASPCGSSLVVIPSLRALSTLLCKTRPLLGFHQAPVTFHSNGSHLVVRLHVSALPQETCCRSGVGTPGVWKRSLSSAHSTGLPGQWESRGWRVQTVGQLFLLLIDGVTLGRIFSQSMKWGHSQHPPCCATLKTGQWTGSASTVLGTQCHPGNGSWLALSSYPSTHNWGWLSVLWLSQHVPLRSLRGPQSFVSSPVSWLSLAAPGSPRVEHILAEA